MAGAAASEARIAITIACLVMRAVSIRTRRGRQTGRFRRGQALLAAVPANVVRKLPSFPFGTKTSTGSLHRPATRLDGEVVGKMA